MGERPLGLNAKLTSDGVLLIELELEEGLSWTRTVYLTPRIFAVQAALKPLGDWARRATRSTRAGETNVPDWDGTLTAVATKDDVGHMSLTVGFSDFSWVHNAGKNDEVRVEGPSPCMGFQVVMGPREEGSTAALHAGDLRASARAECACTVS